MFRLNSHADCRSACVRVMLQVFGWDAEQANRNLDQGIKLELFQMAALFVRPSQMQDVLDMAPFIKKLVLAHGTSRNPVKVPPTEILPWVRLMFTGFAPEKKKSIITKLIAKNYAKPTGTTGPAWSAGDQMLLDMSAIRARLESSKAKKTPGEPVATDETSSQPAAADAAASTAPSHKVSEEVAKYIDQGRLADAVVTAVKTVAAAAAAEGVCSDHIHVLELRSPVEMIGLQVRELMVEEPARVKIRKSNDPPVKETAWYTLDPSPGERLGDKYKGAYLSSASQRLALDRHQLRSLLHYELACVPLEGDIVVATVLPQTPFDLTEKKDSKRGKASETAQGKASETANETVPNKPPPQSADKGLDMNALEKGAVTLPPMIARHIATPCARNPQMCKHACVHTQCCKGSSKSNLTSL
jgi:hypothetical protein